MSDVTIEEMEINSLQQEIDELRQENRTMQEALELISASEDDHISLFDAECTIKAIIDRAKAALGLVEKAEQ